MIYEWRTPLSLVAKAYFVWRENAVVEMGGKGWRRFQSGQRPSCGSAESPYGSKRKPLRKVFWPGKDAAAADEFDLAKYVTCSALNCLHLSLKYVAFALDHWRYNNSELAGYQPKQQWTTWT